ncbi:MAG: c-type cytochrome domain-containing protein [Planctomycetota bacterium]
MTYALRHLRSFVALTPSIAACLLLGGSVWPASASAAVSKARQVALAAEAKEILRANCYDCHKGQNAQSGLQVLDHASLIADGWVVPRAADESRVFKVVTATDGNRMPPENRPGLTQEQMATIREWITAGAAEFPEDWPSPGDWSSAPADESDEDDAEPSNEAADRSAEVEPNKASDADQDPVESDKLNLPDDGGVLKVILTHVRSLPIEDRPFYRYFSTRHCLNAGTTRERLTQQRVAFTKAINHLSYESDVVLPKAIDKVADGTVFAIDIRWLDWDSRVLKADDPESPAARFFAGKSLSLYDLVLLEYPYAVHDEDDPVAVALADTFLRVAKQVRPIPYVRADWFSSVVLQPPLYHDMMRLPRTLEELEGELDVETEQNLKNADAQRAGIMVSGVSRNNRVVERHRQRNGYYWKSHDFTSNTGSQNILVDPIDFQPFGGEMIFSLPNGAQGYFVSDAKGRRIDAAPTSIVVDKHASDKVVRNGLGCIRCHVRGIKTFNDDVRDILDVLPSVPGFDKSKARRLYPGNKVWGEKIARDCRRFKAAMDAMECDVYAAKEPLAEVTEEYLETAISARVAAAELGLVDQYNRRGELVNRAAGQLAAVCRTRGFTRLGLASLAAGSVIRRDAWEDNYDAAVRGLGLGVPLVPINGLLRNEYLDDPLASKVKLRTTKKNGVYEKGDKIAFFVDNDSAHDIEVELYIISSQGQAKRVGDDSFTVDSGETLRYPPEGQHWVVGGSTGREQVVLYASRAELPDSVIFRGKNVADRVVHLSYVLRTSEDAGGRPRLDSDAASIVKKSLFVETN